MHSPLELAAASVRATVSATVAASVAATIASVSCLPTPTAAAATTDATAAAATTASVAEVCPAVEVMTAGGSGSANPNDDPNYPLGLVVGNNYAATLQKNYDNVRTWQLPYYGTIGVIASNKNSGLEDFPSYPDSVAMGKRGLHDHVDELRAQCPDTALYFVGYSQGAQIVGDVLEGMDDATAGKTLGAILLSDPKRGPQDGARLMGTNYGDPTLGHGGMMGQRSDGVFNRFEGQVVSICSKDDPVCDADPEGPAAALGRSYTHNTMPAAVTPQVGLDQMLLDGSFLVAVAPQAGTIATAVTLRDSGLIGAGLHQAASSPLIGVAQQNTLHQLADEAKVVFDVLFERGTFDPKGGVATGNRELDTAIAVAQIAADPFANPGVAEAFHVFDRHTQYRGESDEFTTIDGVRVDDWIANEVLNSVAGYLGQPTQQPVPAEVRHTPVKDAVRKVWEIITQLWGTRNPAARWLWRTFDL